MSVQRGRAGSAIPVVRRGGLRRASGRGTCVAQVPSGAAAMSAIERDVAAPGDWHARCCDGRTAVDVDRPRNESGDSTMKKLTVTLASASLLAAAGIALASGPADLALDANRMFFRYWAPGVDSGDFQVLPGDSPEPTLRRG